MEVKSQLERAQLENLSSDPTPGVAGRVHFNTTTSKAKVDDGSTIHSLVTEDQTQTLTNKTLTSPVINSPTISSPAGLVKGDVGLGNVDNTSDATKNAAAVTLTNKTISASSNTISNIAVANLAAGVVDTDLSSVSASDDTLPSAKATKAALDLKIPLSTVTTKGDLIAGTGAGAVTRLPAGTDGFLLKADSSQSSGLAWVRALTETVTTITSSTSISSSSDIILCNPASSTPITVTLPSAVTYDGKKFLIKKIDAYEFYDSAKSTITITDSGSFTTTLDSTNESIEVVASAGAWVVLKRNIPSKWISIVSQVGTSFGGFGTVTYNNFNMMRVGNGVMFHCNFTAGTVSATVASLSMSRWITDSSLNSGNNVFGMLIRGNASATTVKQAAMVANVSGSGLSLNFRRWDYTTATNPIGTAEAGNLILATGETAHFFTTVPIPISGLNS